ncbi:isochorismatase family protein [Archangium violaceum]|uniref:isochorismatase family protein n=1 Tax=Archangium violaceum TaxID=83451 RepID=UPI001EF13B36|nr:isochorismatase family protein [Archangium violaceum]
MNAWEAQQVIAQSNAFEKERLVFAGLWTGVCIVGPVLSALDQGFKPYVITDACGDVSDEAHERAVQRMIQAGAIPMTSLQYLLALHRDARPPSVRHFVGASPWSSHVVPLEKIP